MTILAHPDAVCLKTIPLTDFAQSLGTAKQRLETSLSMLVCGFVAAVSHHASHSAFGDMFFGFALS